MKTKDASEIAIALNVLGRALVELSSKTSEYKHDSVRVSLGTISHLREMCSALDLELEDEINFFGNGRNLRIFFKKESDKA